MVSIYLEVHSNDEEFLETSKVKFSLESLIVYCVYLVCQPKNINIILVPVYEKRNSPLFDICKIEEFKFIITKTTILPFNISSYSCPALLDKDTIVTGLSAVCRYICKFKSTHLEKEHKEGILGFRSSCLQAPKEVSVWTDFCENSIIKTINLILSMTHLVTLPIDLVRFESHLNKPVIIHNKYKIAREFYIQEEKSSSKDCELIKPIVHHDNTKNNNRVCKNRHWKSCKNKSENTNLEVTHKFAEGPFLTLADIVLLPPYFILNKIIGNTYYQSLLPLTYKWYCNVIEVAEQTMIIKLLENIEIDQLKIIDLKIPIIEDVSLYKSDPKRHNPKKRLFTKEQDVKDALSNVLEEMELNVTKNDFTSQFSWSAIPHGANPFCGHLPGERSERKSQQLESMATAVLNVANDGDVIVDFCCGSGHLGILIAYLLPKCTVILLENKERSLLKAKERSVELNLKNILFFQCNVDFFTGKFDIGVALHACGVATDLVLDKCLKSKAKFVLSPCCYGSLHVTDKLSYPRSLHFNKLSTSDYLCISHAADQTHKDHPLSDRGNRCMSVVDSDRARLAEENGYKVTLTKLKPESCTPKNNLLIGLPLLK